MKQKSLPRPRAAPSRLQRELSAGILDLIRTEKLAPGTRLAEVALADRLQVSRTPVRAALRLLASRRLVRQGMRFRRHRSRPASRRRRTPTGCSLRSRATGAAGACLSMSPSAT